MKPRLRKLGVTAHVTFSVGWLGADAGFLALAIAGLISQDAQMVRAAYLAMDVIGWFVIVPFSFAALLTGLECRRCSWRQVGNAESHGLIEAIHGGNDDRVGCLVPSENRLTTAVVIESERAISRFGEIIARDAGAWAAHLVHRRKGAAVVPRNPDGAERWPVKDQVVEFPTAVVVEGESAIGRVGQIVAADAGRLENRNERSAGVPQDPDSSRTRTVEN